MSFMNFEKAFWLPRSASFTIAITTASRLEITSPFLPR